MQSTKDIEQAASGITVTREILPADNNRKDNGAYHVGDKVKIKYLPEKPHFAVLVK